MYCYSWEEYANLGHTFLYINYVPHEEILNLVCFTLCESGSPLFVNIKGRFCL